MEATSSSLDECVEEFIHERLANFLDKRKQVVMLGHVDLTT